MIDELQVAVTRPEKEHNLALDGVRGIAILLVLLHHWGIPLPASNAWAAPVVKFTNSCWVGVDLFFVLSGFLITSILVDTVGSEGFLKKFYARRFLRIFPLYYGVLAALLLLTPVVHFRWGAMLPMLLLYLQNTGIAIPLDNYRLAHGVNLNPYWSLAVEEQFYLVWPLLVVLVKDVRRLTWIAFALSGAALALRVALVAAHVSPWFVYCFTACRADALLLGGALALLLRSKNESVRLRTLRVAPWAGAVAAVMLVPVALRLGGLEWRGSRFLLTVGLTLLAVAACGVVACTQRGGGWRWLGNPVLRFFGRYSYGIYVLHQLGFYTLYKWIEGYAPRVVPEWRTAAILSWLSAAGLVIGAAVLSFEVYEKPFLKMKRHFAYSRAGR